MGSLTVESPKDEEQLGGSFRNVYVMLINVFSILNWLLVAVTLWIFYNLQIISGLLLVPLSMALAVLLGWIIFLISQNKTTIEVDNYSFPSYLFANLTIFPLFI